MPPPPASNIRAFVQWKESTVYAGEEIECIITFKNIARPHGSGKEESDAVPAARPNGASHSMGASHALPTSQSRRSSVVQGKASAAPTRAPSNAGTVGAPASRSHRPTLSLNVANPPERTGALNSAPLQEALQPNSAARPVKAHVRSLSIMSLGNEAASDGRTPVSAQGKRPVKPHVRSASLTNTPKLVGNSPAALSMPSPRQPSPLYEATTPPLLPDGRQPPPLRPARRRTGTMSADTTPRLGRQPSLRKQANKPPNSDSISNFKFPATPAVDNLTPAQAHSEMKPARDPSTMHSGSKRPFSPRPQDATPGGMGNLNPIARVMSETSNDGTPRTSSEFYSMSNHSNETLTSELPLQQQLGRLFPKISHSRRPSRSPQNRPAEPETLMMGYAQTMGHFTLDGSLVNAAPFEDVKRKGVQGGGGVIGVEQSKRSSGLFGALSWGNIGESLGGLLGGDEMSSMAQMKASVGSKTIPLLSTPQSLLFVDLKLAPGDSRSYKYRFALPRGLPPSHKGRAIKVHYYLSLGVQRPERQAVKRAEIPFRVLGSYDAHGEPLGHDLMSPYVLLQDAARTNSIAFDLSSPNGLPQFAPKGELKKQNTPRQGLEDFLRYTERLLESPKDANGVLLSPTSPTSPQSLHALSSQGNSASQAPTSVKESIDVAILRSNISSSSQKQSEPQSANRFNIARSGQPVGVLTILRPAYRLGETITGTIDFTTPVAKAPHQAPTYSVLVELESAEQIDPSLAMRSSHSINRVTRKVHASVRENCLFAHQVSFSMAVPPHAAPSFETTGVSFVWRLKIEFATHRPMQGLGIEGQGGEEELLEELSRDDRGTTFIAKERLFADTFEVLVPLKIYGAIGIDSVSGMTCESLPV